MTRLCNICDLDHNYIIRPGQNNREVDDVLSNNAIIQLEDFSYSYFDTTLEKYKYDRMILDMYRSFCVDILQNYI